MFKFVPVFSDFTTFSYFMGPQRALWGPIKGRTRSVGFPGRQEHARTQGGLHTFRCKQRGTRIPSGRERRGSLQAPAISSEQTARK